MKLIYPILLVITIAFTKFFKADTPKETQTTEKITDFKLTVIRGAFHYDKFILSRDSILFVPQEDSDHLDIKYSTPNKKALDSTQTMIFLTKLEHDGFWELKNQYSEKSSCLSQLTVTLEVNGKSKTVICDDFDRGSPELIKYIDKKVVELEGNDLKRIYLPG